VTLAAVVVDARVVDQEIDRLAVELGGERFEVVGARDV
jgi:hypothetical protein